MVQIISVLTHLSLSCSQASKDLIYTVIKTYCHLEHCLICQIAMHFVAIDDGIAVFATHWCDVTSGGKKEEGSVLIGSLMRPVFRRCSKNHFQHYREFLPFLKIILFIYISNDIPFPSYPSTNLIPHPAPICLSGATPPPI